MGLKELKNRVLRKTGLNTGAGMKIGEPPSVNMDGSPKIKWGEETLVKPEVRATVKTLYEEAKNKIEATMNAINIAIATDIKSDTLESNSENAIIFLTAFITELDRILESNQDQEISKILSEMVDARNNIKNRLGDLNQ